MKSFNKTLRAFVLLGAASMALAPSVFAVGVDLLWAPTYSMATGTPTPTAAFGAAGGGLGFNFRLGTKVDLQLDALYLTRQFNDGADQTAGMASGVLGLKFKFSRGFFLNAGGYYNYYLSGPIATTESDYGLAAGLGLIIPLGPSSGFLINPQYRYALKTLSYNAMVPSEVVALVGFTFGLNK